MTFSEHALVTLSFLCYVRGDCACREPEIYVFAIDNETIACDCFGETRTSSKLQFNNGCHYHHSACYSNDK